jgi:hypothetical protein
VRLLIAQEGIAKSTVQVGYIPSSNHNQVKETFYRDEGDARKL